jgi:hypothetical protein
VEAADAFGAGWHVCASSGDVSELKEIDAAQCLALDGRYVAAANHCSTSSPGCTYPLAGQWPCSTGANVSCIQPICCGNGCDATTGCANGVWPGATRAATMLGPGCAVAALATGVLCCRG